MSLQLTILFLILVLIVVSLYLIVFKYQIFAKFEVKEIKFNSGKIIYCSYQGKYSQVGSKIKSVVSDLTKYSKIKNKDKNSQFIPTLFGIYYDDPCRIVNSNQSRAIVGILLFNSENSKDFHPDEFIKYSKENTYQVKSFQEFTAVGAKFPLFGLINIMSGIFRGYPVIKRHADSLGIIDQIQCSLEIYDYKNSEFTISFPFKSANDLLWLSDYPVPVYKNIHIKKN